MKWWVLFHFYGLMRWKRIDKVAWMRVNNRRILFARSRGQELFYCPGGKREWDENDLQCLRREVREELSVELITPSLRYIQTFYGPAPNGLPMKMACYEGGHRGTMKPSNEVEEIAWFTTADKHRTTVVGVMILDWYEVHNKID